MSVIGPSCNLPSEMSPACGCTAKAPADPAQGGGKAAGAAVTTAAIAVACTACCVLPFMLPAVALAGAGGVIAVLDRAHGAMTVLAVAVVLGAWGWIGWRSRTAGLKIRKPMLAAMGAATLLTAIATLAPILGPTVLCVLGD